ncbi:CdaR family transcriptional regulator [Streptomyces sp. VRA16 Mangrove soil]|uniref:PucR family transcriptional regulator n=1 Tax=Streptomyces sp. VRA16 Mangrove soil TaxID=2817434 RepID=UPI001A9E9217|nr:helix-turn-helix domain-containing protein [Streptomyces sp. VRA16 Mangrove soil]MBO1331824.1 helix-turn-helix domain-containing protein [Streptomyces sp. VRA16 Mangrove soil]
MNEEVRRTHVGSVALQGLVEELAARLRRSVVVDDPLVRFVCSSRHFEDADPVRIRSLLQGRADSEIIRYVLDQGVARWTRPGYIEGRDELGLLTRYCVPLREKGHLLGLLMVVAPDAELTPEEIDTIGRASGDISAQMYADQAASDTDGALERELLEALLGASAAGRAAARQRIVDSGLLPDAAHAVVTVLQVTPSHESPGQIEVALRGALEGLLRTRTTHGLLAVAPDRAVVLQVGDRQPGERELAEQSTRAVEAVRTYLDASAEPVLGVGGRQAGLAEAWTSYEQALVAARAARRLPHLKRVGMWEELGEYAVLLQLPDHALNESLLPKPLRTLLKAPGGQRLEETLRSFLEHAGSVPRTAEALEIHRTSLYYRLRQVHELTGLDLDNGGDRLILHLGLRIKDMLGTAEDDAVL